VSRAIRQRATDRVAVAPVAVSDRTCAALLGLEPRAFRELLSREDVPCIRVGRRVLARVEDVEAVLCRLAGQAVHVDDDETPQPRGVEAVLRLVGREKERA
jgi:hypothetical protein